jgi:hypothetical protein
MLRALLVCLALGLPATAETITFAPSNDALANPGRGWWTWIAEDFSRATTGEIEALTDRGMTVGYAIVRLDDYRGRDLPQVFLDRLDRRFAMARQAGLKVILRFAYNYPKSSTEYDTAQDAPLPRVLRHILQLEPVIRANADTIIAWQAGFIGAWGEGHTSSNGLDTAKAKAAVRDALIAAAPAQMHLQWRYPGDILSWPRGRIGFHNDCYLSSEGDVGTWPDGPDEAERQKRAIARLTDRTYFSGETCDAEPRAIRTGCAAMLAESARFHLAALGRDYHTAFHRAWASQGCLAEIENRLGYRLRLVEARIDGDTLRLRIANEGWTRVPDDRPLLVLATRADGRVSRAAAGALSAIGGGATATLTARVAGLGEATRICLAAPDPSPRLADRPAYAIRFANADRPGQTWDKTEAAFCITR